MQWLIVDVHEELKDASRRIKKTSANSASVSAVRLLIESPVDEDQRGGRIGDADLAGAC